MAQIAESNRAVVECEAIDLTKAAGEFMFLGLRMTEGVSIQKFRARFGKPPEEFYPRIQMWIEGDLVAEQRGHLKLTPKGLMLANSISSNSCKVHYSYLEAQWSRHPPAIRQGFASTTSGSMVRPAALKDVFAASTADRRPKKNW